MGPKRVRIEYRGEWVQRKSELNTKLNGSKEGQNLIQGVGASREGQN
jgi:hypothetical protein